MQSSLESMLETSLDSKLRSRLAQVADLIVPRHGPMPAASEVGVTTIGLRKVFEVRPDLLVPFQMALDNCPDDISHEYMTVTSKRDPSIIRLFVEVIAGAYYMDESVCAILGYNGQKEIFIAERETESPSINFPDGSPISFIK